MTVSTEHSSDISGPGGGGQKIKSSLSCSFIIWHLHFEISVAVPEKNCEASYAMGLLGAFFQALSNSIYLFSNWFNFLG